MVVCCPDDFEMGLRLLAAAPKPLRLGGFKTVV